EAAGLSVWPAGKGKNWGYGGNTPAEDGTIVMILERMNRIVKVDPDLAYAVIEPGVTYRQLDLYLKDHHPTLWAATTDGPPEGSVLGNAIERGLGATPYGDHWGNLCGLEVVLPHGEIIRTGSGADCSTWHTHKWGVGPYVEGLFSQSNYGIVT